MFGRNETRSSMIPTPAEALPGRTEPVPVPDRHEVNGHPLVGPFPDRLQTLVVAMGCFWGAERLYWQEPGVFTTAVGYAGGHTPNPTYEETCTGMTGHTEAVMVVYDPDQVSLDRLFQIFWENHDPTQYMRQGNDIGTQYRSAILFASDAQKESALASRSTYQQSLTDAGYGEIATEIELLGPFYYAEPYHQQYLAKNPAGYCNHGYCQVGYPKVVS